KDQRDCLAGGDLAGLPETRALDAAVIGEQTETTVADWGTRNQARSADNTGGHRWRHRGCCELAWRDQLGGEILLGDFADIQRDLGVRANKPAQTWDAGHRLAQVLDLRQTRT